MMGGLDPGPTRVAIMCMGKYLVPRHSFSLEIYTSRRLELLEGQARAQGEKEAV